MKKKMICVLAALLLSGCAVVVEVIDEGDGVKRIQQHGLTGGFAIPPEAGYIAPDNMLGVKIWALRACPDGYGFINERYVADDGRGGDMYVWRIKCSEVSE